MRRRFLALGAVAVILVSGCSSGGHHASGATTSSAVGASPHPDVIPAVITPAYVNAVFRVLEHIDGDASRALIASDAVTPGVLADVRAIYNDPLYAQEVQIAQESVHGDLANVRHPPGDVRITVLSLISASRSCIFVKTASDYSAVLRQPGPPVASEYWALKPKQAGGDPGHLNPTPWALSFNVDYKTATSIPDQCASS